MSQDRRERRREKLGSEKRAESGSKRLALYALAALLVVGAVYFFYHRNEHQHDAFASCLKDRGVKMYGAYWCPHCQEQKEKFGASFKKVNYIECGVQGDTHAQSQVCKDENVKHYPTWQFPPMGERVERVFSLDELSERTGCALP